MDTIQIAPEVLPILTCFFVSGNDKTCGYSVSICAFTLLCDKPLFPHRLVLCVLGELNALENHF